MANNQSVRRHLDAFTRGRTIGKLEEGRSVTSVSAEFGIAHSTVSRLWRQFQTTGTAIRGFSSGRPRGTTPADDRYIVLQARRNRRQIAGEIARHTTEVTGRPISRFTVARRLHGGGLFARRRVRCVPLTPAHRRRHSLCCREDRNWRDNEWGRVLFTDQSRFSLSSDSHRILIWRERGSRNHPSNIIERDRYGGRGVLVCRGIMLGSRTDLHIFDAGSVNGTHYCNEILLPYVRLFRGAMGLQFLFMDDNAPCHRTVAAEQLLESRRLAARTLPPVTIRELRLALQGEWATIPQQLIGTLILSMGRRCGTCLALQSIPLSNDTVSRRIDDIAEDVEQQLFGKLCDKLFSIKLDEATDSNNDAHFIAYVRFWDASYEWVRDPFQNTPEGLSTTEKESFVDFTSSGEIRRQFCNKTLFQFWAEVDDEFSELKTKAFRILLPFSTSYLCETGFSAVAALKTKYTSQLNIEKELRVSISNIKPSFENLCSARQAHGSH
ncbi:zinc finger BED domain-containing protein 5 [Trichonephila clavipes]|nr:zinc finger BED domain-containing protein 5 [Trichonephila clavipes]